MGPLNLNCFCKIKSQKIERLPHAVSVNFNALRKRQVLKTSVVYFLIRAINGVLGLATVFILTRLLSAEQYGVYALGIATIGLCASVLFQWIAVAVARFYAAHADSPVELIAEGNRLFFRVAACATIVLAIYVVWSPIANVRPELAIAIGVGVIATGLHSLGLQIANASGKPANYALLTISRGALALCAAIVLVQFDYGGIGAIFGVALGSALSITFFRARQAGKAIASSREVRSKMISYGLPLTLTYLSTMVLDVSDRFMIGWWLGTAAVAGYAAAYDLAQQVVGAILNVLLLAAYPRITAAWEAGGAAAARRAMLPLYQALLLGIPLLAGVFIGGAPDISNIAFGAAIRGDAALIIPWIAFAISLGCFKSYFLDVAFQLAKVTHIQLRITVVMAVLNLVLNIVLMPIFGVVGAASATAIAFTVGAVLSWWFGRHLNIYPLHMRDAVSALVVLFVTALCMRCLPTGDLGTVFGAILRLSFGGMVYLAAISITNLAGARSALLKRFAK